MPLEHTWCCVNLFYGVKMEIKYQFYLDMFMFLFLWKL